MNKIIVIGGGISGVSIARMLQDRYEVEILERDEKIGGLIKCDRINGNLFHRVGGHVFNSRDKAVLDWFWNQFNRESEFLSARRNAKIWIEEKFVGYPIENHIYQLKDEKVIAIINELLNKLTNEKNDEVTYTNFRDFLIGNFGQELFDTYFGPYNQKIWNTDLSEVPLSWLAGKLPMPKLQEVIYSNILKKEESDMVHSSFYYPRREGSQYIVNRLSEGLIISCSYTVESIDVLDTKMLSVNNGDKEASAIVYCGDVRQLNLIIHMEDNELSEAMIRVANLPSNGTSNVLCETDDNDISWLYIPEKQFKAHRIIYTGNFSESNNEGSNRKTCVVEFSGKQSQEDMLKDLAKLPGNLIPLAFNYEPNSYVIQNETTRKNIDHLKALLQPYNIYLLGRFAEWEYYNMDAAIAAAIDLNKRI